MGQTGSKKESIVIEDQKNNTKNSVNINIQPIINEEIHISELNEDELFEKILVISNNLLINYNNNFLKNDFCNKLALIYQKNLLKLDAKKLRVIYNNVNSPELNEELLLTFQELPKNDDKFFIDIFNEDLNESFWESSVDIDTSALLSVENIETTNIDMDNIKKLIKYKPKYINFNHVNNLLSSMGNNINNTNNNLNNSENISENDIIENLNNNGNNNNGNNNNGNNNNENNNNGNNNNPTKMIGGNSNMINFNQVPNRSNRQKKNTEKNIENNSKNNLKKHVESLINNNFNKNVKNTNITNVKKYLTNSKIEERMGNNNLNPFMSEVINGSKSRVNNTTKPEVINGSKSRVNNTTKPEVINGSKSRVNNTTKPEVINGSKSRVNNTTKPEVKNNNKKYQTTNLKYYIPRGYIQPTKFCENSNNKCGLTKKEICQAISENFIVRNNIIAAILTTIPQKIVYYINDEKTGLKKEKIRYDGGLSYQKFLNLETCKVCVPYDFKELRKSTNFKSILKKILEKADNLEEKRCKDNDGYFFSLDPEDMENLAKKVETSINSPDYIKINPRVKYNIFFIQFKQKLKKCYFDNINALIKVLETMNNIPIISNNQLNIIAKETKEIIDKMYSLCHYYYIYGIISLINVDISKENESETDIKFIMESALQKNIT
jgi:hypothetical protein